MSIEITEVDDVRTTEDKLVDDLLGAKGSTQFDREMDGISKDARDLFLNPRHTKKYLQLAERCSRLLSMCTDLGIARAAAVSRIEIRLLSDGVGPDSVRINDWLAVLGLAQLCTGETEVKKMDTIWVGSFAYRTLAILKIAVERTNETYTFKKGWAQFVADCLKNEVRGKALTDAVKAHKEYVDNVNTTERHAGMSPERVAQEEAAALAKERDRQITKVNKVVEDIRKAGIEANLSPEDLLFTLTTRGVVPAMEATLSLDPEYIASKLDEDMASKLGKAIIDRGDYRVVMNLCSVLKGWLVLQQEPVATS